MAKFLTIYTRGGKVGSFSQSLQHVFAIFCETFFFDPNTAYSLGCLFLSNIVTTITISFVGSCPNFSILDGDDKNMFCEESFRFGGPILEMWYIFPIFNIVRSKQTDSNVTLIDGFRLERWNAHDIYINRCSIQDHVFSMFFILLFQPSLPKPGENRSCSEPLSFHWPPAHKAGDFGKNQNRARAPQPCVSGLLNIQKCFQETQWGKLGQ